MNWKVGLIIAYCRLCASHAIILRHLPLDTIQFFNLRMLNSSLKVGWSHFCNTDVDEEVMSLFPEFSPSSVDILVRTEANGTLNLSVKDLPQLSKLGLRSRKRTLLIINGISDPQTLDVRANLRFLQQKLTDCNVIVVDFGANVLQIYKTVKRSVQINAFLVAKVLGELKNAGVNMETVTLVGHSVGANVAALGAEIFTEESHGRKLPLLIALDPALMCFEEELYVNPLVCRKVVVVHGENSVLSVREDIGTIDIYPNGDDGTYQPGCSTSLCSHMYPLMLFTRTLTDDTEVLAVKCNDWSSFKRGKCNFEDSLLLGLDYGSNLKGKYYSLTEKFLPFDKDTILGGTTADLYSNIDMQPVILK